MAKAQAITPKEAKSVETYLRKLFTNSTIEVRGRQKAADAAEVYVGEEFIGVLAKDNEDGEDCFQISMTILDIDLEQD